MPILTDYSLQDDTSWDEVEIPSVGLASGKVLFDYWAIPRPITKGWGSGQVFKRTCTLFGKVDIAFGATDGVIEVPYIDRTNGYEWTNLSMIADRTFSFGYWDPPYDRLYKREGMEIWRTCNKLAILHVCVYPTSWFMGAIRTGMVAITLGPMKQIRILQVFSRNDIS